MKFVSALHSMYLSACAYKCAPFYFLVYFQELSADTEDYRQSIDEHNKVFYEMKKRKDQLQSERK